MSSLVRTIARLLERQSRAGKAPATPTNPKGAVVRRAPKGRRAAASYRAELRNAGRSTRPHAHQSPKPAASSVVRTKAAPNGPREIARRLRQASALAAKAA